MSGNNYPRNVSKSITAVFFVIMMIASILPVSTQVPANANQIYPSDSFVNPKFLFGEDEIVYVTGDLDITEEDFIFPTARVYVTKNREVWSNGSHLIDETTGGYNVLTSYMGGGGFWGEIVWLPPLKKGRYDLVLDEDQDGKYNIDPENDKDIVFGIGADWAFQVGGPVGVKIKVDTIKDEAGKEYENWHGLATNWHWVSDAAPAISIAWSLCHLDIQSAVVTGVTWQATELLKIDIPPDYNSAVLKVGGKVIEKIASIEAEHWKTLHDDPPDPDYTEFAAIDMDVINSEVEAKLAPHRISAVYPFSPFGDTSYEAAQIDLANNMAMQAGLISVLRRSIEKYQGAKNVGDDQYIYLQARAVKKLSDMLLANLYEAKSALNNYKMELTNEDLGDYTYQVNYIVALQEHLRDFGLTAEQRAKLNDLDMSDAEIDNWIALTIAQEVPDGDFTMNTIIEGIVAEIDNTIIVLQDLSNQAQAVMDDIGPYIIHHHPISVPGGPYTGNEGSHITFDGSASTEPDGDSLTYKWDFDLDGDFDDGFGATTTWTWSNEFSGMIGLKVTDTSGLSDIAYTYVIVSSVNDHPIIDSFTPAALEHIATQSIPLDFSVTAHDPDDDQLSYIWRLNGVEVSTDTVWTYTPDAGESGLKVVRVAISDGNPLSRDTVEIRVVNVVQCPGDFDGDGDVDGSDLAVFATDFGATDCSGYCEGDFDGDADVDGSDLAVFAADFGRTDCH